MKVDLKYLAVGLFIFLLVGVLSIGGLGYLIINSLGDQPEPKNSIAVINVNGPIMAGSSSGILGGAQANSNQIMKQINQAKDNENIKGILLRVNTPGGSSAASDAIYSELQKFKEETSKPIVVSMGDMAASGGYYISAAADRIYANHNTITGSIGVIMKFANLEKMYDKLGVEYLTLKSGPHKDIGSSNRDMTQKEKKILQEMINNAYQRFVQIIVAGRDLPEEEVKEIADGRIYDGKQAQKLDLVDQLGNFYDAVDKAAQLADIKGEPNLVHYGRQSPIDRLLGSANQIISYLVSDQVLSEKMNSITPQTSNLLYKYVAPAKKAKLELDY
ncbi:signal peptide peptidase SppA [Halanaerobaculum tunisiense]